MTDGPTPPAPPRIVGLTWLLGAARAQRWMWSEAFSQWTRRPLPSERFALHRGA